MAAQGNLLAKSCWGRIWYIFLAWPGCFYCGYQMEPGLSRKQSLLLWKAAQCPGGIASACQGDAHGCWGQAGTVDTTERLLTGNLCQGSPPQPPWQHRLPWAGSRLLTPHLFFLVKNSLEVRQRGAEVFALSVSTLLSVVMPWQWSRKVKRI